MRLAPEPLHGGRGVAGAERRAPAVVGHRYDQVGEAGSVRSRSKQMRKPRAGRRSSKEVPTCGRVVDPGRLIADDHVALAEPGARAAVGRDAEDRARPARAGMRRSARMAGVTVTSCRSWSTVHPRGGHASGRSPGRIDGDRVTVAAPSALDQATVSPTCEVELHRLPVELVAQRPAVGRAPGCRPRLSPGDARRGRPAPPSRRQAARAPFQSSHAAGRPPRRARSRRGAPRPSRRISSATRSARSMGIAKPSPIEPPLFEKIEELTPTTSPSALASGPPELPGLMAASVWIMSR